jgi:glycerol-1-phosphate dehydrogenase [NAD(P)+]
VPLLARMIGTPLAVEIGAGTVARLPGLLADRRISAGGHVAIVVGPGQGPQIAETLRGQLANADLFPVQGGSVETAMDLATKLRAAGFYDAVVGIGGGRTIDIAKYAATISGLPLVSVATSLAHDGLASPVSSLEHGGRKASYGVQLPVAVMVDLDFVRASPPEMRRSGIGDALSNLSAVADWRLAEAERGEVVDGLAATFAHMAAMSLLHRRDGIDDDAFLSVLADALVLSGLAMATAGSSRPCSGGEHEIVHAIDHLFPDTAGHGELAGAATLFACFVRGDEHLVGDVDACLSHHGLPRTHSDLGLTSEQFVQAVVYAPQTRPDRYTFLEQLEMDEAAAARQVAAFSEAFGA